MKGAWTLIAEEAHVCPKPWRGLKPEGSIWQCECGQAWRIDAHCTCPGACKGWVWTAIETTSKKGC